MMVSPYRFSTGGGGGGAISYASAEDLSSDTLTAATGDLMSLTFTASQQTANATYMVLWMAETSSAQSGDHTVTFYQDGTQKQQSLYPAKQFTAPTDILGHGCLYYFTAAATPVDVILKIGGTAPAGATVSFTNKRIILLKLGPNDAIVSAATRQTIAVNTYTTAATLSFTPPSSGDYLILAGMVLDSSTSDDVGFQLSDGVTTTTDQGVRLGSSTRRVSNIAALPLSGISGSKSVTLKYRCSIAGGAGIAGVYMVALRLDRFAHAQVARLGTSNAGTQTTYTTGHSQTFTPAAADYLTLATGVYLSSSTSISSYCRIVDGADTLSEVVYEPSSSATIRQRTFLAGRIANYAASSRTQSIDRKSEGANTTTVSIDAVIASLDLTGI